MSFIHLGEKQAECLAAVNSHQHSFQAEARTHSIGREEESCGCYISRKAKATVLSLCGLACGDWVQDSVFPTNQDTAVVRLL